MIQDAFILSSLGTVRRLGVATRAHADLRRAASSLRDCGQRGLPASHSEALVHLTAACRANSGRLSARRLARACTVLDQVDTTLDGYCWLSAAADLAARNRRQASASLAHKGAS